MVTIMGHVDHGKTTLLDYLRSSKVAAGEAGGITQHIGAFSVRTPNGTITFLDTPGHAAFSSIRARGAKATDLIVLVVAAGDGVMAQTREAITLATKHRVPLVVAINKCDAFGPDAVAKAKEGLLREQVMLEDVGGDTQAVSVSALTGLGIPALLDAIEAQAEIMDLTAAVDAPVRASVIEARTLKGQGDAATILVHQGQLRPGCVLVGDESYCKVRSMLDHRGKPVLAAGPSDPTEITGWKGSPETGSDLVQCASEHEAQQIIDERVRLRAETEALDAVGIANEREKLDDRLWKMINAENKDPTAAPRTVRSYDEVESRVALPTLQLVLKCDVTGSLEALRKALLDDIKSSKAAVAVISSGIGPVTHSDLELAKSTKSLLVCFNVPAPKVPSALKPLVMQHTIIYHLVDEVRNRLSKMIAPVWKESTLGQARVLQLFELSSKKGDLIAGCTITEGSIARSILQQAPLPGLPSSEAFIRVTRDGRVIHDRLRIRTMRHVKKEIAVANKGMECGIFFETTPEDLQPGDVIVSVQRVPSFDEL